MDGAIETLEDYQDLEATASTYLMYRALLEIIVDNSTDSLLVQAAEYLITAADLCFAYRTEYYSLVVDTEASYFFDVLDQVMEEAAEDGELLSGAWVALNGLNTAVQSVNQFKLGADIGEFACNAVINSSDTILRYYEMCAMAEVREALITEITLQDAEITGQNDYEEISEVSDLLMSLLCVNIRGEYCVYRLLTEDAGLLSVIYTSINGETYENWFDGTLEVTNNIIAIVKSFFPDWENYIVEDEKVRRSENIFETMPTEFSFFTGDGHMWINLDLKDNGTFMGEYCDVSGLLGFSGETGENYPNGTILECEFSGAFSVERKISGYIYMIVVDSFEITDTIGEEYYENDTRYICAVPTGLDEAAEFFVYLPGCLLADMDQGYVEFWNTRLFFNDEYFPSGNYGICNDEIYFWGTLGEEMKLETSEDVSNEDTSIETTYTDLTDCLEDISMMNSIVGGRLDSGEAVGFDEYYIGDGIQYGNYSNSSKVDYVIIDSSVWSLYGIYVGENIETATNLLIESSWNCVSNGNEYCTYENGTQEITFHFSGDTITDVSFSRDVY